MSILVSKPSPCSFLLFVVVLCSVYVSVSGHGLNGRKIVCFVGNWARFRPDKGQFLFSNINAALCTHLIYGYARIDDKGSIAPLDPWADLGSTGSNSVASAYHKLREIKLKNPDLKVLLSIGGWPEGVARFSKMIREQSSRDKFIASFGLNNTETDKLFFFDGFDLAWEYPGMPTRGGNSSDKSNLSAFVKSFRSVLDSISKNLNTTFQLSATVTGNQTVAKNAYDIGDIARSLDFVNVLCFNFHGGWEPFVAHHAPMYSDPMDKAYDPVANVNDTVNYYLRSGVPKPKLIVGMPMFGRGFTLVDPERTSLFDPAHSRIVNGPYTRQPGVWSYQEICSVFKAEMGQWSRGVDEEVKAPYAYNKEKWIGYDDVESIFYKTDYVVKMGLGGAMAWSIDMDDFHGTCHGIKFILLKTIMHTLKGSGKPPIPERPAIEDEQPTVAPPTTEKPEHLLGDMCTQVGDFPLELCAKQFFACVKDNSSSAINGFVKVHRECPLDLVYNLRDRFCDFPQNVYGCDQYKIQTTTVGLTLSPEKEGELINPEDAEWNFQFKNFNFTYII